MDPDRDSRAEVVPGDTAETSKDNPVSGRSPGAARDHLDPDSHRPGSTRHALNPEQRRKLDEIFGDVLPETTKDEREPDPEQEDWYQRNKPPHHG